MWPHRSTANKYWSTPPRIHLQSKRSEAKSRQCLTPIRARPGSPQIVYQPGLPWPAQQRDALNYSPPLPCLLKRRCAALRTHLSEIELPHARHNPLSIHSALHHHTPATTPSSTSTQKLPSQSVSPPQCSNNHLRCRQRGFLGLPNHHNNRNSLYFAYTPPELFTHQIGNSWYISMAFFILKVCFMLQAQLDRAAKPHKLASLQASPLIAPKPHLGHLLTVYQSNGDIVHQCAQQGAMIHELLAPLRALCDNSQPNKKNILSFSLSQATLPSIYPWPITTQPGDHLFGIYMGHGLYWKFSLAETQNENGLFSPSNPPQCNTALSFLKFSRTADTDM